MSKKKLPLDELIATNSSDSRTSTQNSDLEERHKELFLREELIEEGVLLLLDESKFLPIEQNSRPHSDKSSCPSSTTT